MRFKRLIAGVLVLVLLWACSSEQNPQVEPTTQGAPALVRSHSPIIGPAQAPVTVVEFFDPSCEGCRAFYPLVKKMLVEYPNDVRLVLRYVPFHGGSEEAVRLLEAARAQGIFQPVLEEVLAVQPQWHNDPELTAAWQAAGEVGLDIQAAREQGKAPSITANLALDMKDAMAFKVTRTPTFFVNGRVVEPFGAEQLYNQISSAVAQARQQ